VIRYKIFSKIRILNILAVIFMIYNGEIVFFKGFLTSFNLMTVFSIESLPAVHFFILPLPSKAITLRFNQ